MAEIGKYNKLKVTKSAEAGVYLDGEDYGELLLPKNQLLVGDPVPETLKVFLYCDSDERVVATTKKPYGVVGEFVCLTVIDIFSAGAFLDWGLPKDLFVPLGEQEEAMEKGEPYVVYIYKEKGRDRLAASAKLDSFLDGEPVTFQENDPVDLLICCRTDLGYNAIINNSHWGLLYEDEVFQQLHYGQKIGGFIKKIRPDEKIDLRLQNQGYSRMDDLEDKIIDQINKGGGSLSITDKSAPELIYSTFGVSKKKYKMALGALYKARRIVISQDVIRLQ